MSTFTYIRSASAIRAAVNRRKQDIANKSVAHDKDSTLSIHDCSIQADDLLTLLRQPIGAHLIYVDWRMLTIRGDFSLATEAIANHCHPGTFYLWLKGHSHDESHAMVKAVGRNPKLRSFTLVGQDAQDISFWDDNTLVGLVEQAKDLFKVHIESVRAPRRSNEDEISTARQFLSACLKLKNLTHLQLLPTRQNRTLPSELAAMFSTVPHKLKTLELRVSGNWDFSLLANSLTETHSLENLKVQRSGWLLLPVLEKEVAAFGSALEICTTLKELSMDWHINEYNIHVSESCHEAHRRVKFLLQVNTKGRIPTADDWMDQVADEDNASLIYFYLRQNPLLCFPGTSKPGVWQSIVEQMNGLKRKASVRWNSRMHFMSTKKLALVASSNFVAGATVGAVGAVWSASRNCSA